jgi:hypothetical protein
MSKIQGSRWSFTAALFICGMAAAGCATTSKDFKLSKVGPGEAAIAGRLTIVYNGQVYTENCSATFGGRRLQMAKDGIVLFVVPAGKVSLERLDCQDVSNQHIGIRGVHFVARGGGVVTDVGDVAVTWEAAGGFKVTALFGAIGALIDEVSDDGAATVVVRPPVAEVREAFKAQTGVDGVWSEPLVPVVTKPLARAKPAASVATSTSTSTSTASAKPPASVATCADSQAGVEGPCDEHPR